MQPNLSRKTTQIEAKMVLIRGGLTLCSVVFYECVFQDGMVSRCLSQGVYYIGKVVGVLMYLLSQFSFNTVLLEMTLSAMISPSQTSNAQTVNL